MHKEITKTGEPKSLLFFGESNLYRYHIPADK